MDATAPTKPVKINRLLPYWAVFQADLAHTLRSWVYRVWVLMTLLAAAGYLLYRFGVEREAGMVQYASLLISDLLRWTLLASATPVIVLTAGSISSERGTMADSVLSRGISRYQYFLGKWHARLVAVIATFFLLGLATLASSIVLLHEDLSLLGSLVALAAVGSLLVTVVSCGVTISAVTNSTLLGIAVLWTVVYGTGYLLSLLPGSFPSPEWALSRLPLILRGHYDLDAIGQLLGWSLGCAVLAGIIGMLHFARRDV
jgi:ABC-type transport system involved in multi-copper enzyme maturation permease subunit